MPGLMATREEFAAAQPQGRAHVGSLHDHPDGRADRGNKALGAEALGVMQHLLDAGPLLPPSRNRHAVFAIKGESLADYWDYTTASLNSAPPAPKAKAQHDPRRRRGRHCAACTWACAPKGPVRAETTPPKKKIAFAAIHAPSWPQDPTWPTRAERPHHRA
ncbi:Ewing's tumor-associated antigen 1 [Manis javanica]|nr:Ewing's tumor-associated antigen 1 [Manis javanica]